MSNRLGADAFVEGTRWYDPANGMVYEVVDPPGVDSCNWLFTARVVVAPMGWIKDELTQFRTHDCQDDELLDTDEKYNDAMLR